MASLGQEMKELETLYSQAKAKETRNRDAFVESRTRIEQVLKNFAVNIKKVDPKLLAGIPIPEDLSPAAILPSLYKDHFDREAYNQELERYNNLRRQIALVTRDLVRKAKEELTAYVDNQPGIR